MLMSKLNDTSSDTSDSSSDNGIIKSMINKSVQKFKRNSSSKSSNSGSQNGSGVDGSVPSPIVVVPRSRSNKRTDSGVDPLSSDDPTASVMLRVNSDDQDISVPFPSSHDDSGDDIFKRPLDKTSIPAIFLNPGIQLLRVTHKKRVMRTFRIDIDKNRLWWNSKSSSFLEIDKIKIQQY
ncbi:unnamed protein product [Ambrosiozyma monospora]|uniref:Unnamed protein product n=1 Tax=Ambrosiozyma monospora TaxID=43982 RepID=A0ACB5UA19_AMBMO|nr:unnamed protein product [Ambrosiozyma monospora]